MVWCTIKKESHYVVVIGCNWLLIGLIISLGSPFAFTIINNLAPGETRFVRGREILSFAPGYVIHATQRKFLGLG